jgi:hypothetical protein
MKENFASRCPSQDIPGLSHGLWSLWDIMEAYDAAGITRAVLGLGNFAKTLPRDAVPRNEGMVLPERNLENLKQRADFLCSEFIRLELSSSLACAERIQQVLIQAQPMQPPPGQSGSWVGFNPLQTAELKNFGEDLGRRLPDELRARVVLTLPLAKAEFFRQTQPPFGKTVQDQFPSLIDEISEAAKCYSFDRSTACAFHSIRCLEAGIGALSRCLGIPDPTKASERNWGKVLSAVKAAVDNRWPTNSDRMSGDGEFFDNAYAALAAMQNPWRNATMHLDQKYTEDEAKHVFDVVRGFMMKISSRMNESGQPLA